MCWKRFARQLNYKLVRCSITRLICARAYMLVPGRDANCVSVGVHHALTPPASAQGEQPGLREAYTNRMRSERAWPILRKIRECQHRHPTHCPWPNQRTLVSSWASLRFQAAYRCAAGHEGVQWRSGAGMRAACQQRGGTCMALPPPHVQPLAHAANSCNYARSMLPRPFH